MYEAGALHPDVEAAVDLEGIMREMDASRLEEAARQLRLQERE